MRVIFGPWFRPPRLDARKSPRPAATKCPLVETGGIGAVEAAVNAWAMAESVRQEPTAVQVDRVDRHLAGLLILVHEVETRIASEAVHNPIP